MTYWLSQYPNLAEQNIASYSQISPNSNFEGENFASWNGTFLLSATSPSNTSESLNTAIAPMIDYLESTWPGLFQLHTTLQVYTQFYDWWIESEGPDYGGIDLIMGSRLLDAKVRVSSFLKSINTNAD